MAAKAQIPFYSPIVAGLLCLVGSSLPCPVKAQSLSQGDAVHVVAAGMAPLGEDPAASEEEAIGDAKRNAVEQVMGVFLRARTLGENAQVLQDAIDVRTEGFIRSWRLLPHSVHVEQIAPGPNGRLLCLQIEAEVAKLSAIHNLHDIRDAYNDLGKPRLLVKIACADIPDSAQVVQQQLAQQLRAAGYELALAPPADVVLKGTLHLMPTVRLGDVHSPYKVGEVVAVCRAQLALQAYSPWSEETLFAITTEGSGSSFLSDSNAAQQAAQEAAANLFTQYLPLLTQELLVRWAKERLDGHPVALHVGGLTTSQQQLVRQTVEGMHGFCDILRQQHEKGVFLLLFRTRLATQDVAARLAHLPNLPLHLHAAQGMSLVYWPLKPASPLSHKILVMERERGSKERRWRSAHKTTVGAGRATKRRTFASSRYLSRASTILKASIPSERSFP